jgi:hypothetical protein
MLMPGYRFHEGLIVFFAITLLMPVGHLFHLNTLPGAVIRLVTLIPRECFYALWFSNRWREVKTVSVESSKEIELDDLEKRLVYTGRFTTKVEEVLALEEAILVIAAELHYTDLVRLGRTSKSMRELVFPQGDLKMRKAKLRKATCRRELAAPNPCWNCNVKICMVSGGPLVFLECLDPTNAAYRLAPPTLTAKARSIPSKKITSTPASPSVISAITLAYAVI